MPKGVYKRTKEYVTNLKKSLARPSVKRKMIKNAKRRTGWRHSDITKDKMSLSAIMNKSKEFPELKGKARKLWRIKQRRILKLNCIGSHTVSDWENLKAQYNWTCPCCRKKETKINLTEDHIIPLSKGGSDNIENIQPLCGSCNSKKYTKIIKYEKE